MQLFPTLIWQISNQKKHYFTGTKSKKIIENTRWCWSFEADFKVSRIHDNQNSMHIYTQQKCDEPQLVEINRFFNGKVSRDSNWKSSSELNIVFFIDIFQIQLPFVIYMQHNYEKAFVEGALVEMVKVLILTSYFILILADSYNNLQ